ncbi:MAG: molybdopterin-dependent oxidoreductase [Pseudomonadales bacterium]|nr:molybdopterin-dependent oxidoreductase [Pseudomonadales bacterium]
METVIKKKTFCRVCEPACGLVATVANDELLKLEADKDHPISKGFVCNKGIYGLDIHNDPDRLRVPLKKTAPGVFEEISWEVALEEISERTLAIRNAHGEGSIAAYAGNPGAFNTLLGPSFGRLMMQIGVRKFFGSGTQDCANKFAGAEGVFGTRTLHPVPDIDQSDFILIIGENPAVSHMSFVSIPHPMQHLKDAEARGAKVVYLNPREIESAKTAGQVTKIKPDTDVYLLAAMLNVIDTSVGFDEAVLAHGANVAQLREFVAAYPPEKVSSITGITANEIRALAMNFAHAPSACVHMSTGVNMGRQGTVAYWLLHMLSFVTGNLGRAGGNFYSAGFYDRAPAAGARLAGEFVTSRYGTYRKPGGVGIQMPGNLMPDYLRDPEEPVHALFVSSGNPILSVGGEDRMREAIKQLDLLVCVDIYRNATGEYADYVLPAAGAYEREDVNVTGMGLQFQPSVQFTGAVVTPAYERKPDWWIYEKLAQKMGLQSAFDQADEPDMWGRVNAMLKSRGHSIEELRNVEIIALERSTPENLYERIQHDHGQIDCYPELFQSGVDRMALLFKELDAESSEQLKLISKRDSYMFNSWYSNVAKLKHGDRTDNYLFMHPEDAEIRQIADGGRVAVTNQYGNLETTVKLTDDLMRGVVAMTHGWGQGRTSGMKVAQAHPGANCNALLPSGRDSFEPLSNQSHMTGIPVDVTAAG